MQINDIPSERASWRDVHSPEDTTASGLDPASLPDASGKGRNEVATAPKVAVTNPVRRRVIHPTRLANGTNVSIASATSITSRTRVALPIVVLALAWEKGEVGGMTGASS